MSLTEKTNNPLDLSSIRLGIVCPMANEKESAEKFVGEVLLKCRPFNFKTITLFIIFDNSCTDGTMDILKDSFKDDPEVKIIYAPENLNVVDAYLCGYNKAISERNDWILEIDAGFSHQPSDIPLFFETMHQGFDCVFGSRFMEGGVYSYNNIY